MRIWLGFLFLLLVMITMGLAIQYDSGYLLIAYGHTTVEMPLWLGIVGVLVGYLLFHLLIEIFIVLFRIKSYVGSYRFRRRQRTARQRTHQGLIELAEGHWSVAEKLLIRAAPYADMPLLNYLSAAKAAQEQGEDKRRDRYLRRAHQVTQRADIAVGLTQAQLQLDHGQFEQSLATLCHLKKMSPKHPFVLKLLKRLYLQVKDWEQLYLLLPELKRAKIITKPEAAQLEIQIFQAKLSQADLHNKPDNCAAIWADIPREHQTHVELVSTYCDILLKYERYDEAETLLRFAIKKAWDETLILRYGRVHSSAPAKQLSFAEQMLKDYPHHPTLLLTLGRLSVMNQLWGKAERYFSSSLAVEKRAETYAELGLLLEKLDQRIESAECFRKGLLLVADVKR